MSTVALSETPAQVLSDLGFFYHTRDLGESRITTLPISQMAHGCEAIGVILSLFENVINYAALN